MTELTPQSIDDLRDAVAGALATGTRLELRGGGTKALIGAPRDATILDMRGLAGVIDYDPAELVLTVGAGTPLAEIEALVAGEGQMLAFEPWDHGRLHGAAPAATIGGVVAAGVAGPRRVTAGSARDHLLGFKAVSGRGEIFVAGAKVVKNVTGYDLPKLAAGSWGRLFAMAELTLKVLPRPRVEATLAIAGLEPGQATTAMAAALGSNAEVSATAHLPAGTMQGAPLTLFRVTGFAPSVEARCAQLPKILAAHGAVQRLAEHEGAALWDAVRHVAPLDAPTLWRIHLPPSRAASFVAPLAAQGARWMMDWGGGLVWLGWNGPADTVRAAAEAAGGQAMLVRAPAAIWATTPAQHPRQPGVMAIEHRVRLAFDPAGLFETGRFLDLTNAD
jgi:glycolate oxidase FAD binding subunit